MKKKLTLLTGIAFLIAILIACGCTATGEKETEPAQEDTRTDLDFAQDIIGDDTTKVFVFVEETFIDCRMHLIMQNVKHTGAHGKKVVDTLTTVVYPGYTVFWKKTKESRIHKIHQVRVMDTMPWNLDTCLVGSEIDRDSQSLVQLVIPSTEDTGSVKYEIIFEYKDEANHKSFWCIDPHLRIPPQ